MALSAVDGQAVTDGGSTHVPTKARVQSDDVTTDSHLSSSRQRVLPRRLLRGRPQKHRMTAAAIAADLPRDRATKRQRRAARREQLLDRAW